MEDVEFGFVSSSGLLKFGVGCGPIPSYHYMEILPYMPDSVPRKVLCADTY